MTKDQSKSEAYLKTVQPTGGALTPEQSEIYQQILIEEGHSTVTASGILEHLAELQKKSKNANDGGKELNAPQPS